MHAEELARTLSILDCSVHIRNPGRTSWHGRDICLLEFSIYRVGVGSDLPRQESPAQIGRVVNYGLCS